MYRYRYINKHEQFGRVSMTLLLEDLEGSMPAVRIDKEFPAGGIDDDFLYKEAAREIVVAQSDYDQAQALAAQQTEGEE